MGKWEIYIRFWPNVPKWNDHLLNTYWNMLLKWVLDVMWIWELDSSSWWYGPKCFIFVTTIISGFKKAKKKMEILDCVGVKFKKILYNLTIISPDNPGNAAETSYNSISCVTHLSCSTKIVIFYNFSFARDFPSVPSVLLEEKRS
jgi:hypothetical protein